MIGNYEKAANLYQKGLKKKSSPIHEALFNNLGWNQYISNPKDRAEVAIDMLKDSIAQAEPNLRKLNQSQMQQENVYIIAFIIN